MSCCSASLLWHCGWTSRVRLTGFVTTWVVVPHRAAEAAAKSDITQALLPLLAPGSSWVIQGRCCGVLTLLIRQELRRHVSEAAG